jgi:transmembrane protein TMEM174 (potassium channel)
MTKGRLEAFSDGVFAIAATLVALASPIASVILYAAITIFYVLESSIFGRS